MTIVFMYHGIYSTWKSNLHTCPIQQNASASVYLTCFAICLIFWICLNDSEEMVNQISFHNPFKNQKWFINYLKASFKQLTENVNCNVIIEILSRKCCLFGFDRFTDHFFCVWIVNNSDFKLLKENMNIWPDCWNIQFQYVLTLKSIIWYNALIVYIHVW